MPGVTVVVCAYSSRRRAALEQAIGSVLGQLQAGDEMVVVIDHNPVLLDAMKVSFPEVKVLANVRTKGLSGARNCGVDAARSEIVAFLDDDAEADALWLTELRRCYAGGNVLGTGGHIAPKWAGSRPKWLPAEFDWVVGCSYAGLPRTRAEIRNPIGCNMSIDAKLARALGGFRESLGRDGDNAAGNEETELFIRAKALHPHLRVVYEPACRVRHHIAGDRENLGYFLRRCWAEGRSKARLRQLTAGTGWLGTERGYALRTLPRGVAQGLADGLFRLDPFGLARAVTIGLGFTAVTLSYALALTGPRRAVR